MNHDELFVKFLKKCPIAVLTQVAIRGVIGEEFDPLFEKHRGQQYERTLTFSAMATAVADVTLRLAGNFRQAYQTHKEELRVSLTSFYNKINATELATSEAIVARSAQRAAEIQDRLEFPPWPSLSGYNVYALDGNHLQESEKRLQPLRLLHDAPLAGTAVARFDLRRQLFDRVYLLEDAHAQESTVLDRALEDLGAKDLILADRHYCILSFLTNATKKRTKFVVRQHGRFKGILLGKRRRIGVTETGTVYEQSIATSDAKDALVMRRITVELNQPTRDGDTVIHLLTNLPASVNALAIADLYRERWEAETGFFYVTTTLTCELPSIGNPRAALFLFSMALMAFNIRQVTNAALYAEHDAELVNNLSHHAMAVEISRFTDGMLVVLDNKLWQRLLGNSDADLATRLRQLSRGIDLRQYKKSKRGPKKIVVKPPRTRHKTHVSTAKILKLATQQTP